MKLIDIVVNFQKLNDYILEVLGFLKVKFYQNDMQYFQNHSSHIVAELRKKGLDIPVIYLSAKDKESQVEEGFLRGGDDYITKPFNMNELILRIKAVLKRTKNYSNDNTLTHRDMVLDKNSRTLTIDGDFIDITKLEFDLLHEFILNKNRVLDRDHLLENVWRDTESFQYRTVNVAINRIKEKIDPDKTKEYIETVRGIGYKIR